MVDRHAFDDRLQQRGLAGARRRDDQRALPVADRRNQIDRPSREFRAGLRRAARFERQLPIGIAGGQRVEIGALFQDAPASHR